LEKADKEGRRTRKMAVTGVTLICKKVNDKWTVYKKEYEWIE
jgi:hypothetical protein